MVSNDKQKEKICTICIIEDLARANCPAGIYLLKVNNINTRTRCEIYFTPCSSVSIFNFEHAIVGWAIRLS